MLRVFLRHLHHLSILIYSCRTYCLLDTWSLSDIVSFKVVGIVCTVRLILHQTSGSVTIRIIFKRCHLLEEQHEPLIKISIPFFELLLLLFTILNLLHGLSSLFHLVFNVSSEILLLVLFVRPLVMTAVVNRAALCIATCINLELHYLDTLITPFIFSKSLCDERVGPCCPSGLWYASKIEVIILSKNASQAVISCIKNNSSIAKTTIYGDLVVAYRWCCNSML